MFFKISQELVNNLRSLLSGTFLDEEFQKGIETFENLINIEDDQSDFDQEYGMFLNETDILSAEWNVYSGYRLEGFFRKIEKLNGNTTNGDFLKEYNAIIEAYDNPVDLDFTMRFEKIKGLFIIYLEQCIKNFDLINAAYENELLTKRIDFVKFASERIELMDSFNREFLQFSWYDENHEQFMYDFKSCIKFIGEAGMGKTTQMKKMFFKILELVKCGQMSVLPIWIELSEMSDSEDASLENKIKGILGEYGQYYSLLLKKNRLVLFLDGYNEVLSSDKNDTVKRKLSKEIDDIHTKYPMTLIMMTDRSKKSTPPCLTKGIKIFTFNGLSREEMCDYIALKTEKAISSKIIAYIESEAASWIGKTKIIPAKVNSLIDLMKDDIIPNDEQDFYEKYLEFILEREANEKKETQIDSLKYLLYLLAEEMNHPRDEKSKTDIIKLWLTEVADLAERMRLFRLAIELPILVPGSNDMVFKFAYPQYFDKMHEGF